MRRSGGRALPDRRRDEPDDPGSLNMKIFLIGALLITFPAIIVAIWAAFTGRPLILAAALVSLLLNTFPFLAAMFLLRGQKDASDLSH